LNGLRDSDVLTDDWNSEADFLPIVQFFTDVLDKAIASHEDERYQSLVQSLSTVIATILSHKSQYILCFALLFPVLIAFIKSHGNRQSVSNLFQIL
jgi:steroid 5-alpha reductase family enzyme